MVMPRLVIWEPKIVERFFLLSWGLLCSSFVLGPFWCSIRLPKNSVAHFSLFFFAILRQAKLCENGSQKHKRSATDNEFWWILLLSRGASFFADAYRVSAFKGFVPSLSKTIKRVVFTVRSVPGKTSIYLFDIKIIFKHRRCFGSACCCANVPKRSFCLLLALSCV